MNLMNGATIPVILTLVAALALPGPIGAQSIGAARTAYAGGQFVEAAELAEAIETSEGYALAARALTIHSHYIAKEDEKEALFERAMQLAQRAIDSDPTNPEAHLQFAYAMGRHAQSIGSVKAAGKGYAKKSRKTLEQALRLDPDMAHAHLALAAWHVEVVRAVGSLMGGMVYGARKKEGLAHYERALEIAPEEKVVLVEYALGLLLLDDDEYREQAQDLLERSLEIPSEVASDRILHRVAIEKLTALGRRPKTP